MKRIKGYIQNIDDVYLIVHGIRLGLLKPEKERISKEERENITSGSLFYFIENDAGMKRWTDGKTWSPSKIHGPFLLYKEVPKHLSKSALKKDKIMRDKLNIPRNRRPSSSNSEGDEECLFKKTVSLEYQDVTYHIIAYFRPILERRYIIDFGFFKILKQKLEECPKLLKNEFIEECSVKKIDIIEKYDLPIPVSHNVKLPVDREELEMVASSVLNLGFK